MPDSEADLGKFRAEAEALGAGEESDEVLAKRVQEGDTSVFDILIGRYKARLYRLIYHMTSNHEDAGELLQDTFLNAFKAMGRFRSDARFSTWIYRIAVNITINHIRRTKRRPLQLSLDQVDPDQPELVAFCEELAQAPELDGRQREEVLGRAQQILNRAMQTLSHSHRTVVTMHYIEGLPLPEVARILGVPVGTVKTRMFHAYKQLRKKLEVAFRQEPLNLEN
jgi:RNA polymerase sigma-70 factor (ECF subfamily)